LCKAKVDRHQSKQDRDQNPKEKHAYEFNGWGVLPMIPTQGLKCTLETVHQMESQHCNRKHIKNGYSYLFKCNGNFIVQIFMPPMIHRDIPKLYFEPKMVHVDADKHKNNRTQKRHALGVPLRICVCCCFVPNFSTGLSVIERQRDTLHRVDQYHQVKTISYDSDDRIVAHEIGVDVEKPSAVIQKKKTITKAMDNEETAEEKPCKAHDQLLSERGLEKLD
jgi:hypothetical protein